MLAGSAPLAASSAHAAPECLRQCTTITAWTTLLGAALALLAIHRLEARARRCAAMLLGGSACHHMADVQQNAYTCLLLEVVSAWASAPSFNARREFAARVAAPQQGHHLPSRTEREAAKPPMLPLSGWWAADLFLLSSCMWQAATVLARWLAPD